MSQDRSYYVYIMASKSRVLYIGFTNDLQRRVHEHKNKLVPGFTSRCNVNRLVWCEETGDAYDAIEFEKKLKLLNRAKKVALIEEQNPNWDDLAV